MQELEKFKMVNKASSIKELQDAILLIAKDDTEEYSKRLKELNNKYDVIDSDLPYLLIQGRTKVFDAIDMAAKVDTVVRKNAAPNLLTREFGIRQQALYLKFYHKY